MLDKILAFIAKFMEQLLQNFMVTDEIRVNYGNSSYVHVLRMGKLAQFFVTYNSADGQMGSWKWKTIATLPEKWRPFEATTFPSYADRTGGLHASVVFEKNGDVKVGTRSGTISESGSIVYFTGHYFLKN